MRNVLFIHTGGETTLKGTREGGAEGLLHPTGYASIDEVLATLDLGKLKANGINILTPKREFVPKSGAEICTPDWVQMAQEIYDRRTEISGVVISHGKDTLHYTASALSFMLQDLGFPVVLTSGFRRVFDSRTNTRENLITALYIAAHIDVDPRGRVHDIPIVPEVCVWSTYTPALIRGNRTVMETVDGSSISLNYPYIGRAGKHIEVFEEFLLPPPFGDLKLNTAFESQIVSIPYQSMETLQHFLSGSSLLVEADLRLDNWEGYQPLLRQLSQYAADGHLVALVCGIQGGLHLPGSLIAEMEGMGVCCARDMTVPSAQAKARYLLGKYPLEQARALYGKNLRGEIKGELLQGF